MKISELEDKIALLSAAVNSKTGQREADRDPKYRAAIFNLQVELENAKAAESKQVRISPHQLHGMNIWDVSKSQPDHVALTKAHAAKPELRGEIEKARAAVFNGERFTMSPELTAAVRK